MDDGDLILRIIDLPAGKDTGCSDVISAFGDEVVRSKDRCDCVVKGIAGNRASGYERIDRYQVRRVMRENMRRHFPVDNIVAIELSTFKLHILSKDLRRQ